MGARRTAQTIRSGVTFAGRGLFTGAEAVVVCRPAPVGHGVVVYSAGVPIPVESGSVVSSLRCTKLQRGDASVQTVEHLLAAIYGLEIDNLAIEVTGPEIPIFDGSSQPFVEEFLRAGLEKQKGDVEILTLEEPVSWSNGETHLVALPSDHLRISATLHYPTSPYLKSQYISLEITPATFVRELAPCRTFALYEEIAPLIERGLFPGGGLDNGVVIRGNEVLNPEGVRFPDEMVRHKVLDLIGDLAPLQAPLHAHIIAIRSGHAAHHALVNEIRNTIGVL